ncbi:hypothetical protein PRZ48_004807 [Zasmidium cellare]|uniref:Protein kinase domain-containing protein n=1 Tax=Zasmidium cellare TaxID=395010 RepID=A0ABR0EQT6_ZASCE|nr:hypothetical protein PRZ48_004807 [Zasmidium cellare]
MAKLGDFGLSLMSEAGIRSSEVALFGYRFNAPVVWEITLSVYSLMKGNEGLDNLIGTEPLRPRRIVREHFRTHRVPLPFDEDEVNYYSEDLRTLVMDCLKYLPGDRPTFDEVLKRLRRRTGYGSTDWARGLRHAPANDPQFTQYGLLLNREQWPMRSILANEPDNALAPDGLPRPPPPGPKKDDSSDESDDSLGGSGSRVHIDPTRLTLSPVSQPPVPSPRYPENPRSGSRRSRPREEEEEDDDDDDEYSPPTSFHYDKKSDTIAASKRRRLVVKSLPPTSPDYANDPPDSRKRPMRFSEVLRHANSI